MANQGVQFNPQGAKEVQIHGLGPQLGQVMPVGKTAQPAAPVQAGAPISPAQAPRGAQPVSLAGGEPQAAPQAQRPVPRPQMGGGTFFGQRGPQMPKHIVTVQAMTPDGKVYMAEAVFPGNSKVMGYTEREEA